MVLAQHEIEALVAFDRARIVVRHVEHGIVVGARAQFPLDAFTQSARAAEFETAKHLRPVIRLGNRARQFELGKTVQPTARFRCGLRGGGHPCIIRRGFAQQRLDVFRHIRRPDCERQREDRQQRHSGC